MKIELTYEELLAAIRIALDKAIKMEWLKKNEHITMDGVVGSITGDIYTQNKEIQKNKDIANALTTLEKYMPSVFQRVIEELNTQDNTNL